MTTCLIVFGTMAILSSVWKCIFKIPDAPPKEVTWSIRASQVLDVPLVAFGIFFAVMTFGSVGSHDNCSSVVFFTGFIAAVCVVGILGAILCVLLAGILRNACGRNGTRNEQLLETA